MMILQGSSAITIERDIEYVAREGNPLCGDFYRPAMAAATPVLVAVHGGGWRRGSRNFYEMIGRYLAQRGTALFTVDYTLAESGRPSYPHAVHDIRAAVQYLRLHGPRWNVDPGRIGLIGDSAGGHLSALIALAGENPPFAEARDDAYPGISCQVKAVVGVYGIYDMVAQWEYDQFVRPRDHITEIFLGTSLIENRHIFHEASPLTYATTAAVRNAVLLVWGTEDDVVEPTTQSIRFATTLKRAGFFVRTLPLPGAPHFWINDPLEEPDSIPDLFLPKLLRFLNEKL